MRSLECCKKKVVSGSDNGMDGTYLYKRSLDEKEANTDDCHDDCIYTREDMTDNEYCFKSVSSGAPNINYECEAQLGCGSCSFPFSFNYKGTNTTIDR